MTRSIEEICRRVLAKAVEEGIVAFNDDEYPGTESVEDLTAGDLCGVANLLQEELRQRDVDVKTTP